MTIIIDEDSDFTDGKNKEFGVNAKGMFNFFGRVPTSRRILCVVRAWMYFFFDIPVPLFPQHVATLHADGDIGFSKEYEAIQSASFQGDLNSEHSMNEDNKNKNRYLNIVACKSSFLVSGLCWFVNDLS